MLLSRLWSLSALWFGLYLVFNIIEKITDSSEESILQAIMYLILAAGYLAIALIPGFKGNSWREKNLADRGYDLVDTFQAETKDAAVAKTAKGIIASA